MASNYRPSSVNHLGRVATILDQQKSGTFGGRLRGVSKPLRSIAGNIALGTDSLQASVHKINLRASAQTVANGAAIEWDQQLGPPTDRIGFDGTTIPGTQIRCSQGGALHVDVHYLFDTFETNDPPVIVHTRAGTETQYTELPGPLTTNWWYGNARNLTVEPGDLIEIRPNASGSPQDLTSASVDLTLHVTNGATARPTSGITVCAGATTFDTAGESAVVDEPAVDVGTPLLWVSVHKNQTPDSLGPDGGGWTQIIKEAINPQTGDGEWLLIYLGTADGSPTHSLSHTPVAAGDNVAACIVPLCSSTGAIEVVDSDYRHSQSVDPGDNGTLTTPSVGGVVGGLLIGAWYTVLDNEEYTAPVEPMDVQAILKVTSTADDVRLMVATEVLAETGATGGRTAASGPSNDSWRGTAAVVIGPA